MTETLYYAYVNILTVSRYPHSCFLVLKFHCVRTMRHTRHAQLISAAPDARTTTTTIHAPPLVAGASEANVPVCWHGSGHGYNWKTNMINCPTWWRLGVILVTVLYTASQKPGLTPWPQTQLSFILGTHFIEPTAGLNYQANLKVEECVSW